MTASKVEDFLLVGSIPPLDVPIPGVHTIVLCAQEFQPPVSRLSPPRVLRCPIPDAKLTGLQVELVRKTAELVADEMSKKRTVLCTCVAGLNRSALVACAAMGLQGVHPEKALRMIRAARGPFAMSNRHFLKYLNSIVLHHALAPGDCAK